MSDPQEQMRNAAREVGNELARAVEQAAKLARQAGDDIARLIGDADPRARSQTTIRVAGRSDPGHRSPTRRGPHHRRRVPDQEGRPPGAGVSAPGGVGRAARPARAVRLAGVEQPRERVRRAALDPPDPARGCAPPALHAAGRREGRHDDGRPRGGPGQGARGLGSAARDGRRSAPGHRGRPGRRDAVAAVARSSCCSSSARSSPRRRGCDPGGRRPPERRRPRRGVAARL